MSHDSKERVAFDLALKIQAHEAPHNTERSVPREESRRYWFELYAQCWRLVSGDNATSVLALIKKDNE